MQLSFCTSFQLLHLKDEEFFEVLCNYILYYNFTSFWLVIHTNSEPCVCPIAHDQTNRLNFKVFHKLTLANTVV